MRPDHLALLPNEAGACSWADGCGVRSNEEQNKNIKGGKKHGMKRTKHNKKKEEAEVEENGSEETAESGEVQDNSGGKDQNKYLRSNQVSGSYQDRMSRVQRTLDAMDTEDKIHFLVDLFDESLVYRVDNMESGSNKLYKRSYSIGDNGQVTFGEDRTEVVEKTEYVSTEEEEETTNNTQTQNKKGGEKTMGKHEEKVEALIANESTQFTEDTKPCLQGLTEVQLDAIHPEADNGKGEGGGEGEGVTANAGQPTKEQVIEVLKEQFQDQEQFLQMLPDGVQSQVRRGLKLHNEERQKMIQSITANSDKFTEDELKQKEPDELEKIASLVKPANNYAPLAAHTGGGSGGETETGGDPLLPAGVAKQAES